MMTDLGRALRELQRADRKLPVHTWDLARDVLAVVLPQHEQQVRECVAAEQEQERQDTLARQLIGEMENGPLPETDVAADDVKAVLYRWQQAKRDTR